MSEQDFDRGAPDVDRYGIRPPPAYAIDELAAPDGIALLRLAGELDLVASAGFRERVDAALDSGAGGLVVDMAEALFIDSSMLKELLRAHARAEESDRRLVVAGVRDPVRRLLDLTRAGDILTLAPTREDALRHASGGA
jgi:anti-sigma B factor antagonist